MPGKIYLAIRRWPNPIASMNTALRLSSSLRGEHVAVLFCSNTFMINHSKISVTAIDLRRLTTWITLKMCANFIAVSELIGTSLPKLCQQRIPRLGDVRSKRFDDGSGVKGTHPTLLQTNENPKFSDFCCNSWLFIHFFRACNCSINNYSSKLWRW